MVPRPERRPKVTVGGGFLPPDIASSDFAGGTASPYTLIGTAQTIIDDPTGAGRVKVYSNSYGTTITSTDDLNRYAQFIGQGPLPGTDLFFRGDVYFPSASISPWASGALPLRKLTYCRDDVNGGTGQADFVVGMFGDQLFFDYTRTGTINVTGVATLSEDAWTTVEWRVRQSSTVGADNGQWQCWINGVSVLNQSSQAFNPKASLAGWQWMTCGHQREGGSLDSGTSKDLRYWDRVAFSTTRIGP